jgi:hypothetical protein
MIWLDPSADVEVEGSTLAIRIILFASSAAAGASAS